MYGLLLSSCPGGASERLTNLTVDIPVVCFVGERLQCYCELYCVLYCVLYTDIGMERFFSVDGP